MPNLYCKVHRLKNALSWTWEEYIQALDGLGGSRIDEKTLRGLFRNPHRKASQQVREKIEALHNLHFQSPFPRDVECLLALYQNINRCSVHATLNDDRLLLLEYIKIQLQPNISDGDELRKCRLLWLIADIHFDQIALLRTPSQKVAMRVHQDKAIEYYSLAIGCIERHNVHAPEAVQSLYLYKLHQNILAALLNAIEPEKRFQDANVLQYLDESDFFEESISVLDQEPYIWPVARNGLRFSSISKNLERSSEFFARLTQSNQKFKDIEYQPLGYPAIKDSSEFRWAIEHLNLST